MRIAIGIISLFLMLLIGLQSCALSFGGHDDATWEAGVGVLVALLFLVAGSFAFKLPKVSLIVFVVAAVIALLNGFSTKYYGDLRVWGFVSLALAALSYFASERKKRRTTDIPPV